MENKNNIKIPLQYKFYKQDDPIWENDIVITKTLGKIGCLITCLSMILYSLKIKLKINNEYIIATPRTLNIWLKNNNGYDNENNYINEKVLNVNKNTQKWKYILYYKNTLSYKKITTLLDEKNIIIGIVKSIVNKNGFHYILITGYSTNNNIYYVNDPKHDITKYSYEDILKYKIYFTK